MRTLATRMAEFVGLGIESVGEQLLNGGVEVAFSGLIIADGLFQVFLCRDLVGQKLPLSCQRAPGQFLDAFGLHIFVLGREKIWRLQRGQQLAVRDRIAELHVQFGQVAGQRRENICVFLRVSLHHRRGGKLALDLIRTDGDEFQLVSQQRLLGDDNKVSVPLEFGGRRG